MMKLQVVTILACAFSVSASADEYWVCRYSGAGPLGSPVVQYKLHDRSLMQVSGAPWSHQVLIDNDQAIVAASGEGIKAGRDPEYPNPIIQTGNNSDQSKIRRSGGRNNFVVCLHYSFAWSVPEAATI
jgi:hypothetical protein